MTTTQNLKVMLAEDDANMRSMLKILLELENFKVSIAPERESEDSILGVMQSIAPDVVLMDVHLNKIDGVHLLRRMRSDSQLSNTRVIMSSGMDMRQECLQAGANAFLMKPYMPDELITLIRMR